MAGAKLPLPISTPQCIWPRSREWKRKRNWGWKRNKLFASLDRKDRKLLIGRISVVVVLAVIIALFARQENRDDNPMPSTYLTGRHGARAAFEMLQANGYDVERREHPLSELAERSDAQTVVIFAEPNPTPRGFQSGGRDCRPRRARVLTGWMGGALAPDGNVKPSTQFSGVQAHPAGARFAGRLRPSVDGTGSSVGSQPAAGPRRVHCAEAPAVVEYASGEARYPGGPVRRRSKTVHSSAEN